MAVSYHLHLLVFSTYFEFEVPQHPLMKKETPSLGPGKEKNNI